MTFSSKVRREIAEIAGDSVKKRFVRQCFIDAGTITDPVKAYHLAFTLSKQEANKLTRILKAAGMNPKILAKNDLTVVYLKEAEHIADVLKMMGATVSSLAFEAERVEKDFRNTLNRQVNCETANLGKTVSAAQTQIDAILQIENEAGLKSLSKPLQDVARLRLTHDTASLTEIGAMLTPPVGKSGVNHRLRKIVEIAQDMNKFK